MEVCGIAALVIVILLVVTAMQHRGHARETDLRVCRGCGTAHPSFAHFCRMCGRKLE